MISLISIGDGSVHESSTRIGVGDVIPADEVVRRTGVVGVGRISIEEIGDTQSELERLQSLVEHLAIDGLIVADVPGDLGHAGGYIVVAVLVVVGERSSPPSDLIDARYAVPEPRYDAALRGESLVDIR